MVGHQEFDQRVAGGEHAVGRGLNFHSVFCGADAGCGVDTGADVDHTDAADADWVFVLLMAEGGDGDAIHARGIEDGGTGGDDDGEAVDGEGDVGGGSGGHGLERAVHYRDAETRRNFLEVLVCAIKRKIQPFRARSQTKENLESQRAQRFAKGDKKSFDHGGHWGARGTCVFAL